MLHICPCPFSLTFSLYSWPKHNEEQQQISTADLNQSQAKLNYFKTENCSQNSVALPNGTCAFTLVHLHCFCFKTRIKALTPNDSTSSFCELHFSRKKSWSRVCFIFYYMQIKVFTENSAMLIIWMHTYHCNQSAVIFYVIIDIHISL